MKKNKKIRRKNRIKKVAVKIFACVIVFAIGMGFGTFLNNSYVKKVEPVSLEQTPSPSPTSDAEEALLKSLSEELAGIMHENHPEVELSFMIENLDTGANVFYNLKQMNSASLIKLFVMEHFYKKLSLGEYEMTEETEADMYHMLAESDNPSVNRFIDLAGGENEERRVEETNGINITIKESGYEHTRLNRKMYNTSPPGGSTGYENYSSVTDVSNLLRRLYKGELLEGDYNHKVKNILKEQKRRGKIPALITEKYPEIQILNKTGELSQVENDAAIITSDEFNLMFVVMTDNIPKQEDGSTNEALKLKVQNTIAQMALRLVEFYKTNEL